MTVTRESLQDSFKLVNDEDLLSQFQSGERTSLAQEVARVELRRRGVDLAESEVEAASKERGEQRIEIEDGDLVQIARFLNPMEAEILRAGSKPKACWRSSPTPIWFRSMRSFRR